MTIERICPICGARTYIEVDDFGFMLWHEQRQPIQSVWPLMPVGTRETLISGMCDDCQTAFFTEE